jgi:hypothetical protein
MGCHSQELRPESVLVRRARADRLDLLNCHPTGVGNGCYIEVNAILGGRGQNDAGGGQHFGSVGINTLQLVQDGGFVSDHKKPSKTLSDVARYKAQQHPPAWKNDEPLDSRTASPKRRNKRARAFGGNPFYEYTVGTNLVVLSGIVTREPRWNGRKASERVWFRMKVPNKDRPGQNLFVSVRTKGPMGLFVYENISKGDTVAVTGQLWTARMPRKVIKLSHSGMYIFVDAERVSGSYPVLIDQDPRYLRVRADFWNRICSLLSDEDLPLVPEKIKKDLLRRFDKAAGFSDDDLGEDVANDPLDPDPATLKEPPDATDLS